MDKITEIPLEFNAETIKKEMPCEEVDIMAITDVVCKLESGTDLAERMMQAENDDDFISLKCPLCDEKRYNFELLYNHMLGHGDERQRFQCNKCDEWCSGIDAILAHLVEHSNKHKCPCCTERFFTIEQLYKHMRIHASGHNRYICPVCRKLSKCPSKLLAHMTVHGLSEEHKCPICGKVITRAANLRRHLLVHNDKKPFSCSICPKSYPDVYRLKHHVRHKHEKMTEEKFPCPECEKVFERSITLKYHLMKHTGNTPYICTVCGAKFSTPPQLSNHMRNIHEDTSSWLPCPKCPKRFKYERLLANHMDSHIHERNFRCSQCNVKVKSLDSLRRHEKRHKMEKAECPICKKKFAARGDYLATHLKRHEDERNYVCVECGRKFNTKGGLRKHSQVHIDEMPYNCALCSRSCRYRENFSKHMKVHFRRNDFG